MNLMPVMQIGDGYRDDDDSGIIVEVNDHDFYFQPKEEGSRMVNKDKCFVHWDYKSKTWQDNGNSDRGAYTILRSAW